MPVPEMADEIIIVRCAAFFCPVPVVFCPGVAYESRSFTRFGSSTIVKVCHCGTCLQLSGARVLRLQYSQA